ncbi:hypothetical protein [Brevundimonas faecalis]|uniref:UrcA family protein n=1 Tax=Brevundimonas faecalis TaxID=947378 RepID=A0ABV2RCJ9_9CAUL
MATAFLLSRLFHCLARKGEPAERSFKVVARRLRFVVVPVLRQSRDRPGGTTTQADRSGLSPVGAVLFLILSAWSSASAAQSQAQLQSRLEAPSADRLCVQVDVGGDRVGHLECAAEALQNAARAAQRQARAAFDAPVPDARASDLTVGTVNQAATRQRLGSAFGHSVQPQRPARPVFEPRSGGRR